MRLWEAVTRDAGERSAGLRDSAALAHVPRVNAGRVPLFCDTALAGRIELAEAQLIARAPARPPAAGQARRAS